MSLFLRVNNAWKEIGQRGRVARISAVDNNGRRVIRIDGYQKEDGTDFVALSPVLYLGDGGTETAIASALDFRGAEGARVWIQYSVDGSSFHDSHMSTDKYIRFAVAISKPGAGSSDWSSGIKFVGQDGDDGDDGDPGVQGPQGIYNIEIYRNAASPPAAPTGGSYVVTSNTLTPPSGWTTSPTTAPTGQNTYISRYSVDPATQTGTISSIQWGTPFQAGAAGPEGPRGLPGIQGPRGPGVSVQNTAPSDPSQGDLWYDTSA